MTVSPQPDSPYEQLHRLIRAARSGRTDAWEMLYARFRPASVAFCRSTLGDADLAEDAFQEAFLEASECIGKLREEAAFPVWFRRILIKQCDRVQRGRRAPWKEFDESLLTSRLPDDRNAGDQPEQEWEREDLRARVRRAVDALPPMERDLCIEYYFEERDQNSISERHGIPLHTIKNRLYNARRLLRHQLARGGKGGPMMMAA